MEKIKVYLRDGKVHEYLASLPMSIGSEEGILKISKNDDKLTPIASYADGIWAYFVVVKEETQKE